MEWDGIWLDDEEWNEGASDIINLSSYTLYLIEERLIHRLTEKILLFDVILILSATPL